MYGHFKALAVLLSPRGADPTCAEAFLSDYHAFFPAKDVSRCECVRSPEGSSMGENGPSAARVDCAHPQGYTPRIQSPVGVYIWEFERLFAFSTAKDVSRCVSVWSTEVPACPRKYLRYCPQGCARSVRPLHSCSGTAITTRS